MPGCVRGVSGLSHLPIVLEPGWNYIQGQVYLVHQAEGTRGYTELKTYTFTVRDERLQKCLLNTVPGL